VSDPKILALDTTTEACSAALLIGGEARERYEVLPRGHAGRILAMLDELLAEAGVALTQLDAIAFCRGPGAFTGVRIACGVAQGAAFGADLPVVPLSTLQVLAQGAWREHGADAVLSAVDARMNEVYWGAYQLEQVLMAAVGEECLAAPGAVPVPAGAGWAGAGTGWGAYAAELAARCGNVSPVYPRALPRALDCLPLAAAAWRDKRALPADQALPVYLRDKVTG